MKKILITAVCVLALLLPASGFAANAGAPGTSAGGATGGTIPGLETETEGEDQNNSGLEHRLEEKRQADAIDGVTASPYWIRQMYLAYRSYNGRFKTADGGRVQFLESLSKVTSRKGNSIALTMRIELDSMDGITFRLDGDALSGLESLNITRLQFCDYNGNSCGQFRVSEFRDQYTALGITGSDLLVYDFTTKTFSACAAE